MSIERFSLSNMSQQHHHQVPVWLLEELQRLFQAVSQSGPGSEMIRQQAAALFPIHLLVVSLPLALAPRPVTAAPYNSPPAVAAALPSSVALVAFAFLPNAAKDVFSSGVPADDIMQHCIAPCGISARSSVKRIDDAAQLHAFLASSIAIADSTPAFAQMLDAAASVALIFTPKLPSASSVGATPSSSSSSSSSLIATVVQNQNFDVVASRCSQISSTSALMESSLDLLGKTAKDAFVPGAAIFVTSTLVASQQQHQQQHQHHSIAQALFRLPGDRRSLAEILDQEKTSLEKCAFHQLALCDRVKNDGSGKVQWQCFVPPLRGGAWCPLLVPTSPPSLRMAFHRALLLPPCPHLLPGRSLVCRLQQRTQQHAVERRASEKAGGNDDRDALDDDDDEQKKSQGGDNTQMHMRRRNVVNFPVFQTLTRCRAMPMPAHPILLDPHTEVVQKRWSAIMRKRAAALAATSGNNKNNNGNDDEDDELLHNTRKSPPHHPPPGLYVVRGSVLYYHYRVDGFDDSGWGCAYRSAQTIVSWFALQADFSTGEAILGAAAILPEAVEVPTIPEIQKVLAVVDPERAASARNSGAGEFVGSNSWIGSYEVMLVLQFLMPDLQCKIIRVESGAHFVTDPNVLRQLVAHFERSACPVMVGGASYAHTILGVEVMEQQQQQQHQGANKASSLLPFSPPSYQLLILDPHYVSARKMEPSLDTVLSKGWCSWKNPGDFFAKGEWYNLCLPQIVTSFL